MEAWKEALPALWGHGPPFRGLDIVLPADAGRAERRLRGGKQRGGWEGLGFGCTVDSPREPAETYG